MKRAKKLYILLGVLAAACLATVIALQVEEYKEQIRTSDAVILEIPPGRGNRPFLGIPGGSPGLPQGGGYLAL